MLTSFIILTTIIGHLLFATQAISENKVRACSSIMKDHCITSHIRDTKLGKQVRLPGGTWTDCAGDCSRKLRESTVDFWQVQMHQN